jgi:hypothetical protein
VMIRATWDVLTDHTRQRLRPALLAGNRRSNVTCVMVRLPAFDARREVYHVR